MLQLPPLRQVRSFNQSSRNGADVRLIVVHDCEGSYEGSVGWFAMPESRVSAHFVLDEAGARATQMVSTANKAWHACNFNPFSIGIEAAGYAAKGLGQPEWQALANIVAYELKMCGIPAQVATADNNWTGYCQHVDLGAAGGGHHDVSTDPQVRAAFHSMVLEAYAQEIPDSWSTGFQVTPPALPEGFQPSGSTRHDLVVGTLEWAQAELNALKLPFYPLQVDGLDGPHTQMALLAFQQQQHLKWQDGVWGPETRDALIKVAPALPAAAAH